MYSIYSLIYLFLLIYWLIDWLIDFIYLFSNLLSELIFPLFIKQSKEKKKKYENNWIDENMLFTPLYYHF